MAIDGGLEASYQKLGTYSGYLGEMLRSGELPLPDNDILERLRELIRQIVDALNKIYGYIKQIEGVIAWLRSAGEYIRQWMIYLLNYDYAETLRLAKQIFTEGVNSLEGYWLLPKMLHDAHLWLGYGAQDYPGTGIRNVAAQAARGTKREYIDFGLWQGRSSHDTYWHGRSTDAYASAIDMQRPYADALVSAAGDASSALRTCFSSGVSYYGNVQITLARAVVALANIAANWRNPAPVYLSELTTVAGWFASSVMSHLNLRGVEGTQTQVLLGARAAINVPWPDPSGSPNWPVRGPNGQIGYGGPRPR